MPFVSGQCMLNDEIWRQGVSYYCHITLHEEYGCLHQPWTSLDEAMYTVSITGQATALRGTVCICMASIIAPNYGILLLCWHHRRHPFNKIQQKNMPCEDTMYMDNCIVEHNPYCHNCNIVYTYIESNFVDNMRKCHQLLTIQSHCFHSESISIHPSLWVRMW